MNQKKKMRSRSKEEYKRELSTSAWMRRKYDILQRDNFVCSICMADNSEIPLDVHHITYIDDRKAWEYPDYLLVTLCRDCHKAEHYQKNTTNLEKIKQWIIKLATPKPT